MSAPRLTRHATWPGLAGLVLICLLQLCCTLAQAAITVPPLQSHVNDVAGVLAARGPAIDAQLKAFEAQTGHQVFVLTVPSTGTGNSIEAYALAVFEQWQPGRKGQDDGALLVIATGDKTMRIEAGYGLEGKLTDLQSARIVREVITPKFRQGDIEGGVADGVEAMLAVIGGQPLPAQAAAAKAEEKEISGAAKWIVLGIFGCLALFALGMSLFAGVFGLLASIAVAVAVVMLAKGDSRAAAWAGAAVLVLAWLLLRWKMVAANVRRYHLPKARHKLLAWLKVYLFAMGFARGGPQRKRERDDGRRSDSDSDSDSSGSSSSGSSTSGTSGSGGRSGGGGASGSW
ncbi:TPM domain-containing protein [Janthinobacterium sp. RB2R34]|uniref:TPM domain-containing protein n=1 Tax=Janthinobacterium sp. RB2R34 TaxID=3424193 RepID=UPI003F280B9F